ncbi:hypothetical protein Srubr_45260 [Streptomyces rubradiris]|uniref:Uncharacterized protein n=1 Tax=Streptomyces rubradiris TaxID=285531 RepID=A0ABQ3RFQ1_STRRR|nr:hypothetical protein GCM10018792_07000 [Streptomyces rubradiris]GHI54680.1 hypothetical protein Srubr_45260 [Streptomyces rubradiris]
MNPTQALPSYSSTTKGSGTSARTAWTGYAQWTNVCVIQPAHSAGSRTRCSAPYAATRPGSPAHPGGNGKGRADRTRPGRTAQWLARREEGSGRPGAGGGRAGGAAEP